MTRNEILEFLEGEEFYSDEFEATIGIHDGKVISKGEVLCEKPTKAQASRLLKDLYYSEFGTDEVTL